MTERRRKRLMTAQAETSRNQTLPPLTFEGISCETFLLRETGASPPLYLRGPFTAGTTGLIPTS